MIPCRTFSPRDVNWRGLPYLQGPWSARNGVVFLGYPAANTRSKVPTRPNPAGCPAAASIDCHFRIHPRASTWSES